MFDSSDSDDESSQASVQTLKVDWLDMSFMGCPQSVALSGLPGCRFRNINQNLHMDLNKIENLGISDVVMLVTKGELRKYRVPNLIAEYEMRGMRLHHYPFPDGTVPSVENVMKIIDTVRQALEENRKVLIHCMGGLGRACVIASCLLQYFENSLTPNQTIFVLREIRGVRAIQTVKILEACVKHGWMKTLSVQCPDDSPPMVKRLHLMQRERTKPFLDAKD